MQETPKATREEEERRRTDSHRHAVCTVSFSFAAKEGLAKRLSPKIGSLTQSQFSVFISFWHADFSCRVILIRQGRIARVKLSVSGLPHALADPDCVWSR